MNIISFWQRVNNLIKLQNKTQNSISIDCGFNSRRVQNLSGANRIPNAFECYKIAQALGVSMEYLITGVDLTISEIELKKLKKRLLELGTE